MLINSSLKISKDQKLIKFHPRIVKTQQNLNLIIKFE